MSNQDDTLYCIACRKVITRGYIIMPYGSRYDNDAVCAACVAKYLDHVIADVIAEHRFQKRETGTINETARIRVESKQPSKTEPKG